MSANTYKRKRYLIKNGFQFAYIGKILLLELLAVVVTAIITSYLFLFVFSDSKMVSAGPYGTGILISTIFLVIMLMFILAWLGVRISHRIAGPIYRFEQTFKEIRQGNLRARIYLRQKDEMKPLAGAFNEMMASLLDRYPQLENESPTESSIDIKLQEVTAALGRSELPANDKDKYRKVLEGLKGKL